MNENLSDEIYKEQLCDGSFILKRKVEKTCSKQFFYDKFPIIKWLPKYKIISDGTMDFVAGLTVGLTAIPQGIAYGVVARLGPEYGLYAAFMGCFVYIFFGTSKDITVGPTAIMALMVAKYVESSPDFAVLLCFLTGIIVFLCGIFNLGFLVQFISVPVTTGFTTAAAITIGSGQINSLFGLASPSNEFIASWENFFLNITKVSLYDSLLGVGTLIALLILRKFKDLKGRLRGVYKYISLSRNALAVFVGILVAYLLTTDDFKPFRLTGSIKPGLPVPKIPPFTTTINGTTLTFPEVLRELSSSVVIIPLIAILESIAIAKAFAKGKIIDASQEMIALGLCNFASSFFHSMPITGSFTRTAVNNASGVRTPLGGAVTGTLILLALALLTQTFYYIPKASLAAIIIAAMIHMVDVEVISEIWRAKKIDCIPFVVTMISCLFFSLDYGMIIGIGVNMFLILFKSARPVLKISKDKILDEECLVIVISENLLYASGEYVKSQIVKAVIQNKCKYVILNGEGVNFIDSTAAMNLVSAREDLKELNCGLIFWNWKIETAGVLYRFKKEIEPSIRCGKTAASVIDGIYNEKTEQITV
ncbi:sodium-independent sulfate anion transporter [Condylostylus longicornis]|uniref:sodium-independent sulfate anion transporter n=1 Tax=Condylostylus longicornis TaxID=2530218 RepID=UPI00244E1DD6|nr:sodium-independent sulfate anion transporter [Condylostylus longicornis]